MAGHKKKGMKAKGMKRGGASRSARTRVDPRGVQRQAPLDAPRGPKKKKKPMNPTKPRIPDPLEGGPSNSGSRRMQKGGAMKAKGMMAGGIMRAARAQGSGDTRQGNESNRNVRAGTIDLRKRRGRTRLSESLLPPQARRRSNPDIGRGSGMKAGGSMKAKGMAKGGKMATKGYAKGGAAGGMRKPSSKNSGLYGR